MAGDGEYGTELRLIRQAAGLTLEELAGASGVSVRAISDMERGHSRGPQHRTVIALVTALGLTGADRTRLLDLARAGRPRPSGAPPGLCDLPRAPGDFTGRAAETMTLRYLADASVASLPDQPATAVVVSGPAGIGKTTLAVQAAQLARPAFSDGQLFVDLRGLDPRPRDPADALSRLLAALGIRHSRIPPGLAERAALYRSALAGRRVLVVADNAASEEQARPLLPGSGTGMVILTSRRRLSGLEGVHRLPLSPLTAPDSGLLLNRIIAASSRPEGDEAGLGEIAAMCGHLPLALRIAGNRLASRPGWTVADLASRLADRPGRVDRLSAGDLRIGAAFTLSYAQLSPAAQAAFRAASVIPGPDFGAELASVAADMPVGDADEALDELDELGLLNQAAAGRFSFHDLIRLFAAAQLAADGPAAEAATRSRMTSWLLGITVVAGRWFEPDYGPPQPSWRDLVSLPTAAAAQEWLQTEGDNWLGALRVAAEAGQHDQVLTVAESLHWFSDRWMDWPHWPEVFSLSSGAARSLGDQLQEATHLNYLSWAQSICAGHHEQASQTALEAAGIAAVAGDLRQQGWALLYAANAGRRCGEFDRALDRGRRSAELLRQAQDWDGYSQALNAVVIALGMAARHAECLAAWQQLEQVIHNPATAPSPDLILFTLANAPLSESHAALRQWPQAIASGHDRLAAARQLGIPRVIAPALARLGRVLREASQIPEAVPLLREAADIYTAIGMSEEAQEVSGELHAISGAASSS